MHYGWDWVYHDRGAGLLQPDEKWTTLLWAGLWKAGGSLSLLQALPGTAQAAGRRKDNDFHCIFLYPCAGKPLTNPFLVQLSAGYPITWGLNHSYCIKNMKENLSAGLNHPRSFGVSSPHCFGVDWQSCERTIDRVSLRHTLPLILYSVFFWGQIRFYPGLRGSMQISPGASSQDSCLKN